MSKRSVTIEGVLDIDYILNLLTRDKERGEYWGRRDYYVKRQDRLIKVFEDYLKTVEEEI